VQRYNKKMRYANFWMENMKKIEKSWYF